MTADDDRIDRLVAGVATSRKARTVDPGLLRHLCEVEVNRRPADDADVIKRVKRSLHRIGGAYFAGGTRYDRWLTQLRSAPDDDAERQRVLSPIMATHSSMRERLPHLDDYYSAIFEDAGEPGTVLDLACGFNPLGLCRMPISPHSYLACDIYLDMLAFLSEAGEVTGHPVTTFSCNLLTTTPTQRADVALLLKTLVCLDQRGHRVGRRLLEELDAEQVIVTYPLKSLSGKAKGMSTVYRDQFWELIEPLNWEATEFDLPSELGFRLRRPVDTRTPT